MQRNNSPILLATIALGLLAILGAAFFFLSGQSSGPAQPVAAVPTPTPAPVERWVAAREIPPRTAITPAMLRKTAITGPAPADAITKLSDVNGQITTETIPVGQTIALSSFTKRLGRATPASFSIPSGSRAVAIYVDPDSTAAGLVDVGDRVDVVATHRLHQEKDNDTRVYGAVDFTAGRLIGSNLLVLGVDKSLSAPKPTPTPAPGAPGDAVAGGPPPQPTPPPPPPQPGQVVKIRVLLAASPEVATSLLAAADQGTLNVIVRNPLDADTEEVPEAREYPSFKVRVPPTPAPPMGGGGGNGNLGGGRLPTPVFPTPIPMATVEPAPIAPTNPSAPTTGGDQIPPNSSEVTVIRGTEKTRVIVPQR
jgi:Flp pilus assembly protein CpaB